VLEAALGGACRGRPQDASPGATVGAVLDVQTLTDGGQQAADIAARLAAWLGEAQRSLDLALYDVRLPGPPGDTVAAAIRAAAARGVQVRIAFNQDAPATPLPAPPRTEPSILEQLGVPLKGIPGRYDLMHHKYVVRDGAAVWSGSTNWTIDSWEREENVLVTVGSPEVATSFTRNFGELWERGEVEDSGRFDTAVSTVGHATVKPWFCPGRGDELAHRIAEAIGRARRRVRVASPVLTSAPVLSTIAQELAEGKLDLAGVVDATQIREVLHQWETNGNVTWKKPLLERLIASGRFAGKRSTPWGPGTVHDFMHAKVTVADDTTFIGSFNLSRSGETNAENVLEIDDGPLADRMAAYVDDVRARYPALGLGP
jgi:phosphatidylserine/phosphatidylglycerophosphate/cardiolipin synthase-like enzyme